jgi:hypothetical protein
LWSLLATRSTAQARQERAMGNPPRPRTECAPGTRGRPRLHFADGWHQHQHTAGSSARARGKAREEVPRGTTPACVHRWGSLCSRRARARVGKQAHERINVDFNVDDPNMLLRAS